MATKNDFLHFPAEHFCTTILALGPPHSGKTWLLLNSLKYWLENGMFEKYYLILPQFKYEMEGSYDFLADKKYDEYVTIYESYHEKHCEQIILEQQKNRDLFNAGKINEMPRVFFCIDDATGQGSLFKSKTLTRFATENRHLFIHSYFLMHYDKGIVEPKVRNNIMWFILYPMKIKLLEQCYDSYIDYPDFKKFVDFEEFFDEYVKKHEHGFLLCKTKGKYNPNACNWFK